MLQSKTSHLIVKSELHHYFISLTIWLTIIITILILQVFNVLFNFVFKVHSFIHTPLQHSCVADISTAAWAYYLAVLQSSSRSKDGNMSTATQRNADALEYAWSLQHNILRPMFKWPFTFNLLLYSVLPHRSSPAKLACYHCTFALNNCGNIILPLPWQQTSTYTFVRIIIIRHSLNALLKGPITLLQLRRITANDTFPLILWAFMKGSPPFLHEGFECSIRSW